MLSVFRFPEPLSWFESSYSGANTTEYPEVARLPHTIAVRDSKAPASPILTFGDAPRAGPLTVMQHQQLGKDLYS
ncbi:DUF397 domain-containing protein [Streptomyces sp. NPDC098085]|uniref:DUF397 domain-containing protein n=1 Tax=Streptomyces sp. NPDC098085 TaxID=3366094 RepID=UPI003820F880